MAKRRDMRTSAKRTARALVRPRRTSGYALVSAILIMFLITLLGILAMVGSTSEQKVVGNIAEEKLMFNYGEQGLSRITSHLHYMNQGLFGAVQGADFGDTATRQVLNQVRALDLFGSGAAPSQDQNFRIDAWLDPQNFQGPYDRGTSRPVAISVVVTNLLSGFTKAFRAKVQPTSIWDLAYFSKNHIPEARADWTAVENCSGSASAWYGCQTVFHQEDAVIGNIYLRNSKVKPDNSRFFVRGAPKLQGQVSWKNIQAFDYGNGGTSLNQTAGGTASTEALRAAWGFRSYSKDIDMFPIEMITNGGDAQGFRARADIVLKKRANRVWKIIFRNDLDVDQDGVYEQDSGVWSRYDSKIGANDGQRDSNDPGVFLLYSIPYSSDQDIRAAHWGDSMYRRHQAMTDPDVGGEIWSSGVAWSGSDVTGPGKCYGVRRNDVGLYNMRPAYDPEDIHGDFEFLFTPSAGLSRSTFPDALGGCSGNSSGIIYVEGDVLVSGIVDGHVTIVATGNIILDHEVQYEEHPKTQIANTPNAPIDMLGLFATGNIIIPNSYPNTLPDPSIYLLPDKEPLRYIFSDDWSDADTSVGTTLSGRGNFDHPYPGIADDGNEEIHAVMVSFGRQACTFSGVTATCAEPTDAQLRNFRVGIYAQARTADRFWYSNQFYDYAGAGFNSTGNDSGTLTIWGAMIQEWPGRVGYDHPTSSCTDGVGSNCRHMGHDMVLYHDARLKWQLPANPWHMTQNPNGSIPFGNASWDVVEWENIDPSEAASEVW